MVDGVIQILDRLLIVVLYRFCDAVLHMILQDNAAYPAQGGPYRSKLDQDLRTISSGFHHPPDGFHMSDSPGQPVQYRRGLCVIMCVTVGMLLRISVFLFPVTGSF